MSTERTVRAWHDEAMSLAFDSKLARLQGHFDVAREHAKRALVAETMALSCLEGYDEEEASLTRSIVYRSAASLALWCEEYDEAKRLIAEGLARNPPAEIADELREVLTLVREALKEVSDE